jgi:hypothetical protein
LELKYSSDVIDIIQFGSSIFDEENANDVDIAVIFNKIFIKEQLEQSQQIKRQLEKYTAKPIHISSFDLESFFDDSNFSREGILIYGKSILTKKDFVERFGLISKLQISYSLKELDKKDKIRLNYSFNGRAGKYGLFRIHGGKIISPGTIEINPEKELIFVNAIKELTNEYKIKKVLICAN